MSLSLELSEYISSALLQEQLSWELPSSQLLRDLEVDLKTTSMKPLHSQILILTRMIRRRMEKEVSSKKDLEID